MKSKRDFTSLFALLRALEDRGSLEPGKREAFAKAIHRLEHALKIGKSPAIEKRSTIYCGCSCDLVDERGRVNRTDR